MRIKHVLIPASLAAATALALPSLAQNMNGGDRGWGDMGRSSEYYDFRDPGADRNYNRYEDSLRDRNWSQSDRRWDESRRNMNRYDRDYGSAQRDYDYDYRYDSRSRNRNDAYSQYDDYGRNGDPYYQDQYAGDRYSRDWRDGDRYSSRYDRDRRSAMGQRGGRYDDRYARDYDRDWRSNQNGGYTADRSDDVDFGDMNIDDRAQWHERTYRGTANRGLHD